MSEPTARASPLANPVLVDGSLSVYGKGEPFPASMVCGSKVPTAGVKVAGAVGLASGGTSTVLGALAPAMLTNPFTAAALAVGAIFSAIFGGIFGRHARKVAEEQQTLCDTLTQVSAAFKQVDAMVVAGTLKPDQALTMLEQVKVGFNQAVIPILKEGGGKCNAACVYKQKIQEEIEKRKKDYPKLFAPIEKKRQEQETLLLIGTGVALAGVLLV